MSRQINKHLTLPILRLSLYKLTLLKINKLTSLRIKDVVRRSMCWILYKYIDKFVVYFWPHALGA